MLASDLPEWTVRAFAFAFGAAFGSFFNVAIYRWPREMSVVSPPSHCPGCGAAIPWWRNVPILGFLILRGRAACCGARLSPRYLLVELITAVLAVALVDRFLLGDPDAAAGAAFIEWLLYFAFVGGLIIVTFVDLEWMEIPDEVSLPAAALGLATVGLRAAPGAEAAALGAGGGFLVVQLLFVWSYERIFGRRGMGEGDAKLLLMIGAFVGWQGALFALVAGALQGVFVAIVGLLLGRELAPTRPDEATLVAEATEESSPEQPNRADSETTSTARAASTNELDSTAEHVNEEPAVGQLKMPFGPFLALGALEFLFFGEAIVETYLSLLG